MHLSRIGHHPADIFRKSRERMFLSAPVYVPIQDKSIQGKSQAKGLNDRLPLNQPPELVILLIMDFL